MQHLQQKIIVFDNFSKICLDREFLDVGNFELEYEFDFVTKSITGANFLSEAVFNCKDPIQSFLSLLKFLFCDEQTTTKTDVQEIVEQFLKVKNEQERTNAAQYTIKIIDGTELILCALLHYKYFFKQKQQQVWVVCDLPPGVGKTTEVKRLFRILKGKMYITTPTAKAAKIFDDELDARTLHSRFNLPAKTIGGQVNLSSFIEKYMAKTQNDFIDFFVFDEFSMYDPDYILPIFRMLKRCNRFAFICGDSCQMPSVRAAQRSLYDILNSLKIHFCACEPNIEYDSEGNIDAALSIKLKRLDPDGARDEEWQSRQEHYKFLLSLRKRIHVEMVEKFKNGKAKMAYVLSPQAVNLWLNFFNNMTIKSSLTKEEMIKDIIEVQSTVLKNLDTTLQLSTTPCALGYENKINVDIFNMVKEKCSFNEENNTLDGSNSVYSNIFVSEKTWQTHQTLIFKNIQDELPEFVGSMVLLKGMFVKCRKNDGSRAFNSQTAIFLGYFLNGAQITVKKIPSLLSRTEYKIGFTEDAAKIKMHIFDLASKTVRRIPPMKRYCCVDCMQKICAVHLGAPCFYYLFNWSINYSSTIFALQGSTIRNEKVYLLSELVFKNNILRTAYIIFSRVTNPKQLVLTPSTIFKLLQHIFGCTESCLRRFCEKQKIDINMLNNS